MRASDLSTGLLAQAEFARIPEEDLFLGAVLGAAQVWGGRPRPSKGLTSPLPPTGLTALFTMTHSRSFPKRHWGFWGQ